MISFLHQAWHRAAWSNWLSLLLHFAFFWMVAAASFSGYIGKWGLRDNTPRFSLEAMLEATADRPFVYRQLLPLIANAADRAVPEHIKARVADKLNPSKVYVKTYGAARPAYGFRYVVVYYLSFLSLLGSLFLLHRIALDAGTGRLAAIFAPTVLSLAFPYMQTLGGYFYDTAELLFFCLAYLLVSRRRIAWFFAMLIPATLNKESFFFYIITLLPLLLAAYPKTKAVAATAAAVLVSGLVNVAAKLQFAAAGGTPVELHLADNLVAYLSPQTYSQMELTYGIMGPRQAFVLTLVLIAAVVTRGWRASPKQARQHILLAAAINLPLFAAFAAVGELRNLSLMYVGFTILIGKALEAEPVAQPVAVRQAGRIVQPGHLQQAPETPPARRESS
ncbi:hypothetical protein ASD15_12075 [Massilia sp. Root351]|jgi:hypothetical protein|uniref:hypothetical protein n=1 Tax=Massilia sp. Root351 TaxID=1736522 RepID=UPI00070B1256|nr:hypothetical protein [Massilia sp. Root351]KQV80669.1 hypothetical protein ASD15_12075 [Massilia sp. Root351]